MLKMTGEEMLDAITELSEMLSPGDLTTKILLDFKECLNQGMSLKEAQNKISWDNSL